MRDRDSLDTARDEFLALQIAEIECDLQADTFRQYQKQAENYNRPVLDKKLQRSVARHDRRQQWKKAGGRIRKPAVATLLCFALAFVIVLSVEAFRVPFLNLFIHKEKTHTNYGVALTMDDLQAAGVPYAPAYIPVGYDLVGIEGGKLKTLLYTNEHGQTIFIEQADKAFNIALDAECEQQTIDLQGRDAHLITGQGSTAVFCERDGVFIKLFSCLDAEETIKIAESFYKL